MLECNELIEGFQEWREKKNAIGDAAPLMNVAKDPSN